MIKLSKVRLVRKIVNQILLKLKNRKQKKNMKKTNRIQIVIHFFNKMIFYKLILKLNRKRQKVQNKSLEIKI